MSFLHLLMLGLIRFQSTPTPGTPGPGPSAAADNPVVQMVQVFLAVVTVLWDFVKTNLIPADVASINIIHIAIWTPVTLGLLALVIAWGKGMWGKRKGAA